MGRTYDRRTLHDKPHPVEFQRYFQYLTREPKMGLLSTYQICVQDPHRLNINVTNCSIVSFLSFKQHLETMSKHLAAAAKASVNLEKVGLLAELFALRVLPITKSQRRQLSTTNPNEIIMEPSETELTAVKRKLNNDPEADAIKKRWTELTVEYFERILNLTVLDIVVNTPDKPNVLRQFTANINLNDDSQSSAPRYGSPALDRHLKCLYKLLLAEKQKGMQFNITLSSTNDRSSVIVCVDSPRCGKTNVSRAVRRQFEQMRSFFLSKDGIRSIVVKLFDQLNDLP